MKAIQCIILLSAVISLLSSYIYFVMLLGGQSFNLIEFVQYQLIFPPSLGAAFGGLLYGTIRQH